jgi:hypothetical protein
LLSAITAFGIRLGHLDNVGTPQLSASMRPNNEVSAATERIAEIAEILAVGLMRVMARKSSGYSTDTGESSLHISARQSSHPTPMDRRMADG